MFATIREAAFDPGKMARGKDHVDEFWRIRAEQPGYKGALTVDAGGGRAFIITLWETVEDGRTAQDILDAHAQRLMEPFQSGPTRVLGRGHVSYDDLTQPGATQAPH